MIYKIFVMTMIDAPVPVRAGYLYYKAVEKVEFLKPGCLKPIA